MSEAVLRVRGLSTEVVLSKGTLPIVDSLDFELYPGRALAVVGESGCGKSLSALSIMRLLPKGVRVSAGEILMGGSDVLKHSVPGMRQVRGSEISMIFQEPMTSLNPVVRVGDQVAEALHLHEEISSSDARARVVEQFRKVGIPDPEARFAAFPHQLSGGLKQRVMIAMALITKPKVLIADEPTTALDVTIQAQIIQLMRELMVEEKTAVLLITHDLGVVNQLADDILVMYAGRAVEQADRRELLTNPRHPYTRGLLGALPSLQGQRERLNEIPGVVPALAAWPKSCRFAGRCAEKLRRCEQERPALLGAGRRVACFAREGDES